MGSLRSVVQAFARTVFNTWHDLSLCRVIAGSMGRMVITILGMVADMELKFIKDRQRAGIDAAKADGIYTGRKKNIDGAEIRRRIAAGATKAAVARELNISRMTFYRALEGQGSQSLLRVASP
jgi:DNA invertase Pin-like site-specific DNA recombinase